MHLMRKGICYVYVFIWQPALCVYMAAYLYVFTWQPTFMCLYGSLPLCVYMAAYLYVFIWQPALMCLLYGECMDKEIKKVRKIPLHVPVHNWVRDKVPHFLAGFRPDQVLILLFFFFMLRYNEILIS